MKDRTEDVRAIVERYEPFEFIPLRLEDAFDKNWWARVGGEPGSDITVDTTDEGVYYFVS